MRDFGRPSTFTPIRSKRNASFLPTSARPFPTHRSIGSAPSSRRAEIVTPSPYQPSPSTITSPRLTPKRTSIRFEADTADLRGQSPHGINDARELSQRPHQLGADGQSRLACGSKGILTTALETSVRAFNSIKEFVKTQPASFSVGRQDAMDELKLFRKINSRQSIRDS